MRPAILDGEFCWRSGFVSCLFMEEGKPRPGPPAK
jgi:hypothetical protein